MNQAIIASQRGVRGAPIAGVIFDRDGVLTRFDIEAAVQFFQDLLPISVYALMARWQEAVEQYGAPCDLASEKAFFRRFWSRLADDFSLGAEKRAALASVDYARYVVSYPEVPLVLEQLRRQDLRLGVLSNFSLASLDHSLVSAHLAHYFDVMLAAPVIGVAKPAAQAYRIALAALQITADQCLYFDDEQECVEGARCLGMRAFLVDRSARADDRNSQVVTNLQPVLDLVSTA